MYVVVCICVCVCVVRMCVCALCAGVRERVNTGNSVILQEQSTEEKPTPTKNKRSGTKRLSTLERTAQEGEAILKVRLAGNRTVI